MFQKPALKLVVGDEMCDDLEKRARKREQNRIAQRNYRETKPAT